MDTCSCCSVPLSSTQTTIEWVYTKKTIQFKWFFPLDFLQWNVKSATSMLIHQFSSNQSRSLIETCTHFVVVVVRLLVVKKDFWIRIILYFNELTIDPLMMRSGIFRDWIVIWYKRKSWLLYTWKIRNMDKIIILMLRKQP